MTHPRLVVGAALCVFALAGCAGSGTATPTSATAAPGGGSSMGATGPANAPGSTPESSFVPPSPVNPSPLPKITAPGSALKFGRPAIVRRYVAADDLAMERGSVYLRYVVTRIEEGDPAVLDRLSDKSGFEGASVYYIRGRMRVIALLGNAPSAPVVGGAIAGVQDDNRPMPVLADAKDPHCDGGFTIPRPVVNKEVEVCLIAIGRAGTKPAGVIYFGDDTASGERESTDPYFTKPIVWRD